LAYLRHFYSCWIVSFGAVFFVWRDERTALSSEQAKSTFPNFRADISEFVRDADLNSRIGFTFFAKMFIVNLSDSKATVRSVYIETAEGSTRASAFGKGQLVRHKEIRIPRGVDAISMTQPVSDSIVDVLPSLNTEPLEKGSHREGWLKFKDFPDDFITQHFAFYVQDGYGTPHGPFSFSGEPEAGYFK